MSFWLNFFLLYLRHTFLDGPIGLGIGLVLLGAVNAYIKISARGDDDLGQSQSLGGALSDSDSLGGGEQVVYDDLSHSSKSRVDDFHPSNS